MGFFWWIKRWIDIVCTTFKQAQKSFLWRITLTVQKSQTFGYFLKLPKLLRPYASYFLLSFGLGILLVILVLGGITLFEVCYIYSSRISMQDILSSYVTNLQASNLHFPHRLLEMQQPMPDNNLNSSKQTYASDTYLKYHRNSENPVSSYLDQLAHTDHMLLASNVEMPSLVMSHFSEIELVAKSFIQPLLLWTELGRFGNHMFEYAASYVIAKESGHIPCISGSSKLLTLFDGIKALPISDRAFSRRYFPVLQDMGGENVSDLVNLVSGYTDVKLHGYFHSWQYLKGYEHDIREQFTIHEHILGKVRSYIYNVTLEYIASLKVNWDKVKEERKYIDYNMDHLTSPDNFTRIGVHVRRGDLDTFYFHWKGLITAPIEYIETALDSYRKKYPSRLFFVCSDDIRWCKENISTKYRDIVFVKLGSFQEDFALLSMCDHSVITSGTFGWWSAWLAGGDVVYYSKFPAFDRKFVRNYYPTTWKGIP